ncbi:MAG: hypothetical protein A2V88_15855 [Elusimicrobia bacterium RBG_16_66_12]|nr:MAG: hypothetical protein A2V88_15855 [Elusimicrobia bacterium RBG_16_66_12]
MILAACQPEDDFRSDSESAAGGASASGAAAQPAQPGVSVSAVQSLAGEVDVANPLEAYTVAVEQLASAREATGANVNAALQHLANARSAYDKMFRESARKLDSDIDSLIGGAFSDAEKAARTAKQSTVGLSQQRIGISLLNVAYLNVEAALTSGDGPGASQWLAVLLEPEEGDGISDLSSIVTEAAADPSKLLPSARETVLDELLSNFAGKVSEETIEALVALEGGRSAVAAEEAAEGLAYYRIIQPDLRAKLGEQPDTELADELEAFLGHSKNGNLLKAREAAQEISTLLATYQKAG